MTSPFDPRAWLPERRRSAPEDRSWLDAWVDLTTWWVDPAIAASQSMAGRPEQVLTQLIDGLARQFEGQRVDIDVRGRRVRARLDTIRLARKRERSELHLDLADVDLGGAAVDRLDVRAHAVRMGAGTSPTFTADDIDVDGVAPLRAVVAMIDERVDDWSLDVDDDDRVIASQNQRHLVLRVEPEVKAGRVRLELRSVRWHGFGVGVPRWLRLDRSYPIRLEPGWTITTAAAEGDRIRFRAHVDRVSEDLDLARLRDAILGSATLRV